MLPRAASRNGPIPNAKTAGTNRLARINAEPKGLYMSATATAVKEDFAALLDESLGEGGSIEGNVIRGTIVRVDDDHALVASLPRIRAALTRLLEG